MNKFIRIAYCWLAIISPAFAAEKLPKVLESFAPKIYQVEFFDEKDIIGDGNKEVIYIVKDSDENSETYGNRTFLIAKRNLDGYEVLAKSDKVILCATCGGPSGDPLEGIEFLKSGFVIRQHGGGWDRWITSYTFKYSKRDRTWQLVKAVDGYYSSDESKSSAFRPVTKTYTPPHDFGKILINEFDPDDYLGKGEK
ncbi:hypothetical protein [Noviherbaspirillum sp.]|jgi:hypothetical protein|uniref:hypothetical protein n=1 Tax=Noviherbaspirillum sp. TaxID=1926288 RepID=UPI0025D5ED10|nr:hypothetical protein [Noviherbaspirillum sp.]